jgi:thioredoxin-like negative regulator of GroEL
MVRSLSRDIAGSRSCCGKLVGSAKGYKINMDDNPSASARFNVRGIPTLILFEDGREKNRLVGLSSQQQIEALVTSGLLAR